MAGLGSPFADSAERKRVDAKIQAMRKRQAAERKNPKKMVLGTGKAPRQSKTSMLTHGPGRSHG